MSKSALSRLRSWLVLRFGVQPFAETVLFRRVTKTPWYQGDGAALLMLLMVLVVTGCFLALTYSPSPETAYRSLREITFTNKLGWFVRALHYWSAGMMMVISLLHLSRHVLMGGYLPPREGTWLIGVALFFLSIINSTTGYTLRWDERAIYAIRVSLNMFYHVPLIGTELVRFVQGGYELGARTLSRLYAVHALFIPLLLLALSGYHLFLVVLHGVTTMIERKYPPASAEQQITMHDLAKRSDQLGEDFHPQTSFSSGLYSLAVFAIVVALALTLGPSTLYPEANLVERSMPMEEWWWHWYSGLIAYLPPWLAPWVYVLLPLTLLLALVALPLFDRSENRDIKRRPIAVLSVGGILVAIFVFTDLRLKSPWTAWPRKGLVPIPHGIQLTGSVQEGLELFSKYGCYNCHAIGGQGSGFGPNLTALTVRLSPSELSAYILEPPAGVAMPGYRHHITEEDLKKVVEFVLVAQTFPREY